MDIEFARTFLAVSAAGNFVGAAQALHVTQSTVSARIKALETQFGVALFRRGRNGAELTAAGHRFLRHAKSLVRTFEQARHEVGLAAGYTSGLTLSGRIALWDGFLPQWTEWMRQAAPGVSLRLEIGFEDGIMQGLVQGNIDIGVMYTPQSRPNMAVERLFDEALMLVTSQSDLAWNEKDYVHVDWGPEFLAQFAARFPDRETFAQRVNIGWLALQLILNHGGSAYFPLRLVRDYLSAKRLFLVEDSPLISLPVYMVYPLDREDDCIGTAIEGLRNVASIEDKHQNLPLR
jgi:DNA-binding transcriptional LysR family regulator